MGVNGTSANLPTSTGETIVLGGSGDLSKTCTAEEIRQASAFLKAMQKPSLIPFRDINPLLQSSCPNIVVANDSVTISFYEVVGLGDSCTMPQAYTTTSKLHAPLTDTSLGSLDESQLLIDLNDGSHQTCKQNGLLVQIYPAAVSVPNAQAKIAALRAEAERILAESEKK